MTICIILSFMLKKELERYHKLLLKYLLLRKLPLNYINLKSRIIISCLSSNFRIVFVRIERIGRLFKSLDCAEIMIKSSSYTSAKYILLTIDYNNSRLLKLHRNCQRNLLLISKFLFVQAIIQSLK